MLRLSPTRIFLREEDLRFHLGRIYLRRTMYSERYDTDETGSNEDENEDEGEDEDGETSLGSPSFSPYAASHFKMSDTDGTSEPDNWSSQDRWQTHLRRNDVCLSTLARAATPDTSLSLHVDRESSGDALVNALNSKGPITQRASTQSRHTCYTGSRLHSPDSGTLTPTSLQSESQFLAELSLNTTGAKIKRGFKPPKTPPIVHLSLNLHELESSINVSLSLPSKTPEIISEHATSQRQEQQAVRGKTAGKLIQQSKTFHPYLSAEPYPPAHSALLDPLVKVLTQALRRRQPIETIIMDRARNPNNSAAWRRGVNRNPPWRATLGEPHFHRRVADHGPETSSAVLTRDSPHQPELSTTREGPSRLAVERARNEETHDEGARMRNAMFINSQAPEGNYTIMQPLHRPMVFGVDVNRVYGFPQTSNALRDTAVRTTETAHLTHHTHGSEAQQRHATSARPLLHPLVMHPPVQVGPPTYLPPPANLTTGHYDALRERPFHMEAFRTRERIFPASLAADEPHEAFAWAREGHVPAVAHRAMDVTTEASSAAGAHHAPDSRSREPEQATVVHRPVEAIVQASPAARVQPFTPVNPPKHAGQEGSATPHGSSSEPENTDEWDAKFKAQVESIERRLNRMIADDLREPENISIYDYGLGALRRKPFGEWYREAVHKDK